MVYDPPQESATEHDVSAAHPTLALTVKNELISNYAPEPPLTYGIA